LYGRGTEQRYACCFSVSVALYFSLNGVVKATTDAEVFEVGVHNFRASGRYSQPGEHALYGSIGERELANVPLKNRWRAVEKAP
jgi:hypothetical protein